MSAVAIDLPAAAASTNLDQALELAAAGYSVYPAFGIVDGHCTCPDPGGKRCKPGKHPRTERGHLDATRDPAQLRAWWQRWPDANPAVNLELTGIVAVAPDAPYWQDTFERQGLPESGTVVQSGGGAGHRHYYFRRPEGCPEARICETGQYDILSAGGVVGPGALHESGARYTLLTPLVRVGDLPECPAWAVERLRREVSEREAKRERAKATRQVEGRPDAGADDDEPPVVLDERGMRRWRGELVQTKPDGALDRSGSLVWIARALRDGGATRRTIVAALAERDEALGWRKFTDRTDATIRYAEIAELVLGEPRLHVATAGSDSCAQCEHFRQAVDELRAENAQLRAEMKRREELQALTFDALRGPETRGGKTAEGKRPLPAQERMTIVKTISVVSSALSRDQTDGGKVRVYLPEVAGGVGCSAQTAGRHLDRAEQRGILRRHYRRDPATGHTDLFIELATTPEQALREVKKATRDNWDGRPAERRLPRCPDHPTAPVVERSVYICQECGQRLGAPIEHVHEAEADDQAANQTDGDAPGRQLDGHEDVHRSPGPQVDSRAPGAGDMLLPDRQLDGRLPLFDPSPPQPPPRPAPPGPVEEAAEEGAEWNL